MSLRSGTAIKAVLIYVTDYITKPGLKTHAIFDCIRSVFQRSRDHPDIAQRSRIDRARKLMTQMVNVLGAKTELGSPMICSYLLGFPDHYTNRQFVTFYWKSFVLEASHYWKMDDNVDGDSVKVTLHKSHGAIVGVSPIEDYIHRPAELDNMPLYEWICLCNRESNRATKTKDLPTDDPIQIDSSADEHNFEDKGEDVGDAAESMDGQYSSDGLHSKDTGSLRNFIKNNDDEGRGLEDLTYAVEGAAVRSAACVPYIDHDTNDGNLDEDRVRHRGASRAVKKQRKTKYGRFQFRDGHPLAHSHHMRMHPVLEQNVPNFVGGMLPHKDKGNREYYCLTMLTLFRPWRTGKDLQSDPSNSWDTEFGQYPFSKSRLKIMANFNLRYECLDARDDYRVELMQSTTGDGVPLWFNGD
ncbi:hypothetical protein IW261DRAFT_1570337 [Armillaria novae-zelandiae]|uniref:Uncharacterized protein n=1 Tax=Armillaria novae-zelandiae TaxID=153914 RepID=A0AA39NW33_9AGAR|nr:hypothetical protein IW261DRAFT_1570337 [Armillaria novae-zelandiae]